jgi:putative tryptophan/tyrosine transport system substrate-binding protein
MHRRDFVTLLGGAVAAWPLAARAQQAERLRRVGVLSNFPETDPQSARRAMAFQQGLAKLGWMIARNLQIDYRWGAFDDDRARVAAAELLRLVPDVILCSATSPAAALQRATRTTPIVFIGVSEPVEQGYVSSLAHPGGNMTGFTNFEPSIAAKWVELLKQIAPQVTRCAVVFNPASTPIASKFVASIEMAASKLGVDSTVIHVHEPAEIEAGIEKVARDPDGCLIFLPDTFIAANRQLIVGLVARNKLPSIYPFGYFAAGGGLISYGPDLVDQFRRAASYVDRILRGEKPGDLPVQQPTKFELVINLKTAKSLGLIVPQTLLVAADELIE